MKYRLLFLSLIMLSAINTTRAESIMISTDSVISLNFTGVGVQWSAYPHADSPDAEWGDLMTEKKWQRLYDRLDYMKPRFIRVMDQANWRYFKGFDEAEEAILSFDNAEINSLYKILDYCQKNDIVVMFGEWGTPGHCHDKDKPEIKLRDGLDSRWHKMIAQWVKFLVVDRGYSCIKYYDFINEPNGNWASTDGNFAEWALGVRMLSEEFRKIGVDKHIKITGPGSVPNYTSPKFKDRWSGGKWTDYTSEVLGDIIGAYNTHAYFPHTVVRNGAAAEFIYLNKDVNIAHSEQKPLFLGEIGLKSSQDKGWLSEEQARRVAADGYTTKESNMFIYDYFFGVDITSAAIQCLNAGVDAMAVWDLDDAMHTQGDTADKTKMKRWGFWNSLATELHNRPEDEAIRPWYYAWSWLCRYMPPKSEILRVEQPQSEGCQLLVAKLPEEGYSILLVNTSSTQAVITLKSRDIATLKRMNQLIYNEKYTENRGRIYGANVLRKVDLNDGLTITLEGQTFTILTTLEL